MVGFILSRRIGARSPKKAKGKKDYLKRGWEVSGPLLVMGLSLTWPLAVL